jgi:hypothetical protein
MVVQKQRIKELQSSFEVLKQVSIALPIGLAGLACLWNAPLELQVNFTGCAWVGILGTVLLLAHLRKRITGTSAMSARVAGVLILFSTVMPALWYMFFQFAFNLALAPVMAALQKLDSTPYAAFIYICAYVAITAVVMQMNRVVRAAQLHNVAILGACRAVRALSPLRLARTGFAYIRVHGRTRIYDNAGGARRAQLIGGAGAMVFPSGAQYVRDNENAAWSGHEKAF